MPFKSKAQMRAAFGGYLGSEMKAKAKTWVKETPNMSKLPMHKMDKKHAKDMKAHHSGKGTRARLNTAAERGFFKSKISK